MIAHKIFIYQNYTNVGTIDGLVVTIQKFPISVKEYMWLSGEEFDCYEECIDTRFSVFIFVE